MDQSIQQAPITLGGTTQSPVKEPTFLDGVSSHLEQINQRLGEAISRLENAGFFDDAAGPLPPTAPAPNPVGSIQEILRLINAQSGELLRRVQRIV